MKMRVAHCASTYGPMLHKNFAGALAAFFEHECPQLGGERTRRVLVQSIQGMVHDFYPQTSHLKAGQIQWTTVAKDEKASYGKRMEQTRLTSVILDLVRTQDIQERADGKRLREIKKEAVARLFTQSYAQGGCMTNAELGVLLKIAPGTVSAYTREWEFTHGELLPRRGTIHDMGPTLTHKKEIIQKLFLEGKSVEDVSRLTYHSPEAIHRYIMNFKQVLLCVRKGLATDEIAFAIKHSKRLVEEYQKLIAEFGDKNTALENLLKYRQ